MTQVPPLGERIRRARRAKGWTQQQLAAAIGSGVRAIPDWESGKYAPRWDYMQVLERELGPLLTPLDGEPTADVVVEAVRDLLAGVDPATRSEVLERLQDV